MDRSISITARKPVCIDDDLIDTKWPYHGSGSGVHYESESDSPRCRFASVRPRLKAQTARFLRHVRSRQIQSEIFAVNFQGKEPGILPYADWVKAKDAELLEWRQSLDPLQHNTSTGFDWFDFVTFTGQLYLHMHCPRNPHPDSTSTLAGFEAAAGVTGGFHRMLHRGFLKFDWHCAHQAMDAGALLVRLVKDDYQTLLRWHSSLHINQVLSQFTEVLVRFPVFSKKKGEKVSVWSLTPLPSRHCSLTAGLDRPCA
jgi:hypothetical protein